MTHVVDDEAQVPGGYVFGFPTRLSGRDALMYQQKILDAV